MSGNSPKKTGDRKGPLVWVDGKYDSQRPKVHHKTLHSANSRFARRVEINAKHTPKQTKTARRAPKTAFLTVKTKRVLKRQSQYIIGKYAPIAAAKLVQLTESEKDETSRKACLDVIMLQSNSKSIESDETESAEQTEQLSGEQASRILAALAEVENNGQ